MVRLILAVILAVLLFAFSTLPRTPAIPPTASLGASETAPASVGAPSERFRPGGETAMTPELLASPTVTAHPSPTADLRASVPVSGIASWGDGWSGVVTRLPRGTRITVCGALGCWSGRSVGYGPAKWTGRIADLSRTVFAAICGDPAKGLCRVTLSW